MIDTGPETWPQAAIAIAGIALVGSVVIISVWQALATWRARMSGTREVEYRTLAEQAVQVSTQTLARLDETLAELRLLRADIVEHTGEAAATAKTGAEEPDAQGCRS